MPMTIGSVGLVLGAGGFKGPAHIGLIKSMIEKGFPLPSAVAGLSAGSLVGGYLCSGRVGLDWNSQTVANLKTEWDNFLGNIDGYAFYPYSVEFTLECQTNWKDFNWVWDSGIPFAVQTHLQDSGIRGTMKSWNHYNDGSLNLASAIRASIACLNEYTLPWLQARLINGQYWDDPALGGEFIPGSHNFTEWQLANYFKTDYFPDMPLPRTIIISDLQATGHTWYPDVNVNGSLVNVMLVRHGLGVLTAQEAYNMSTDAYIAVGYQKANEALSHFFV